MKREVTNDSNEKFEKWNWKGHSWEMSRKEDESCERGTKRGYRMRLNEASTDDTVGLATQKLRINNSCF